MSSTRIRQALKASDWLGILFLIYFVHGFCITFIVLKSKYPSTVVRPFAHLPFLYLFEGWDSIHFFHLSEAYTFSVWPPLYPLALRYLTKMFSIFPMALDKAAWTVNFLSHAFIVYGLKRYALKNNYSLFSARALPLLVLFFPAHNVFFAAYSESLYLAITLVVFLMPRRGKYVALSSFVAGLASLVRTMGVFLCFALVLEQIYRALRTKKEWGYVAISLIGLCIFFAWCVAAPMITGKGVFQSQEPWVKEILKLCQDLGVNPHIWLIRYLMFSFNWETFFVWASCLGAVYCGRKGLYLEMLYILSFNGSLFVRIYHPYPWTRFISVLFPWNLPMLEWFQKRKVWTYIVIFVFILITYRTQARLFSGRLGEP